MTSYEQVPGYDGHKSGPNGPITRIVLHSTVNTPGPGVAEQVAHYFQSPSAGGLAHYVVGVEKVIQCCPDDISCWHAPPNHGSIGIEMTDQAGGDPARWNDANHQAVLTRTAALVHELAAKHSVPLVFVNAADLQAGRHGITTHHEVSVAFGQSSHTDPGPGFGPYMAHILAGAPAPAPAPRKPYPGDLHAPQYLRRGMTHSAVGEIRARFRVGSGNEFGDDLNSSMRHFQAERHLGVDGVVGPATWKEIWR
jgi:hypothetical protein